MKKPIINLLAALVVTVLGAGTYLTLRASDHDDGEMDLKGRSLNLTDLYVFREDWQDGGSDPKNLIFIMNTNPRSLARQQYYFSTNARYEFHVTRVESGKKSKPPTGQESVYIGFEFGSPDTSDRQPISMVVVRDGKLKKFSVGTTTSLSDMNSGKLYTNNISVDGHTLSVFAGLREDPFFFDVERYFRIRGLLLTGVNTLGTGPIQGGPNVFRSDSTAVDFAAGYNVNSIVMRVPIAALQSSATEPVFDVWETISIKE